MNRATKPSRGRQLAAACIVAAGFCFLAAIYSVSLTDANAARRDFIGYWAAARQMVHGADPYNADAVLRLEKSVGLGQLQIKLTPSPPAGLALILPIGCMSAKNGLVFWMMLQLACLAGSIGILWLLLGKPATRLHLFGFLFAPALACIMAGQVGVLCLFGITLFLFLHKSRPFFAGAALLPCSLKPHLFLPVILVLLLWVIAEKAYRLIAGFLVTLAASDAIVTFYDRDVWSQYLAMLRAGGLHGRFAPTLSAYLRWDIHPQAGWLEYLLTAIACVWAVWYFWRRRRQWRWTNEGMLILLVAIACAPYAWITDEAILLPAVLLAVFHALASRRSLLPIALFAAVALIELFCDVRITSWYYTWTAPAWLLWFLYATRLPSIANPTESLSSFVDRA